MNLIPGVEAIIIQVTNCFMDGSPLSRENPKNHKIKNLLLVIPLKWQSLYNCNVDSSIGQDRCYEFKIWRISMCSKGIPSLGDTTSLFFQDGLLQVHSDVFSSLKMEFCEIQLGFRNWAWINEFNDAPSTCLAYLVYLQFVSWSLSCQFQLMVICWFGARFCGIFQVTIPFIFKYSRNPNHQAPNQQLYNH